MGDDANDVVPTVLALVDGEWVPVVVRFHGGTAAHPASLVWLVRPDRVGEFEVVTADRLRPIIGAGPSA